MCESHKADDGIVNYDSDEFIFSMTVHIKNINPSEIKLPTLLSNLTTNNN